VKRTAPFSDEEIVFIRKWGIMPIDRTGLLHDCLHNVNTDSPLPDATDEVTLQQCIDERCGEIAGKPDIALMWSGGIDSTLAFYALVDHGISFECLGDQKSVAEYPELADQIKRGQFSGVEWVDRPRSTYDSYYKTRTLVTGELGDQMVGTDKLIFSYPDKQVREQDSKSEFGDKVFDRYHDAIKTVLGRDYLTVAEFAWAMNFLFKFTNVKRRMKRIFNLDRQDRLSHFFDSQSFQRWALQNYRDNVHFDEVTDYKMAYKDYIHSHNGDDSYRSSKVKEGSLVLVPVVR